MCVVIETTLDRQRTGSTRCKSLNK